MGTIVTIANDENEPVSGTEDSFDKDFRGKYQGGISM